MAAYTTGRHKAQANAYNVLNEEYIPGSNQRHVWHKPDWLRCPLNSCSATAISFKANSVLRANSVLGVSSFKEPFQLQKRLICSLRVSEQLASFLRPAHRDQSAESNTALILTAHLEIFMLIRIWMVNLYSITLGVAFWRSLAMAIAQWLPWAHLLCPILNNDHGKRVVVTGEAGSVTP